MNLRIGCLKRASARWRVDCISPISRKRCYGRSGKPRADNRTAMRSAHLGTDSVIHNSLGLKHRRVIRVEVQLWDSLDGRLRLHSNFVITG